MSSTASLQFAPEWLKPRKTSRQPSISGMAASPALSGTVSNSESAAEEDNARKDPTSHLPHTLTTYSSLLTGRASPGGTFGDGSSRPDSETHPFRYSKEQMLQVWKDGGGRGALNLEVERWPGVVREAGSEPISLKEWSGEEKKLFSQPLHSSHVSTYNPNHGQPGRRHPQAHGATPISTSVGGGRGAFGGGIASPRDGRFGHNGGAALGSPVSGGNIASPLGRRRKDDNGDTHPVALYRPRQLSVSTSNGGVLLGNPNLPSPRTKPGFEGVLGDSWIKKKVSDKPKILTETLEDADAGIVESNEKDPGGKDLPAEDSAHASPNNLDEEHLEESPHSFQTPEIDPSDPYTEESQSGPSFGSRFPAPSSEPDPILHQSADIGLPPGVPIFRNEEVLWRYKDPSGQIQGPFPAATMQTWFESNYFTPDLLIQRYRPLWDQTNPNAFEPLADYRKKLPPSLELQIFSRGMELAPPLPPNLPTTMPSSTLDNIRESSLLPPNSSPMDPSLHGSNSPHQLHGAAGSFGVADHQTSIDIHSNGTAYSGTVSSAHASPAFSNTIAQGYGNDSSQASLAHASPGSVHIPASGSAIGEERQRQEREEFFKLLREMELATGTVTGSGPLRSGSVGGDLAINTGLLYPNGPLGNPQQAVPRSPLYSTAGPSVSQQASYSPQQPSYLQSVNVASSNAGPRLAQGQYPQRPQNPSSLPSSPFQPQPPTAWQQASSAQFVRQTPPHQTSFPQDERDVPVSDPSSWNDSRPRDSFTRQPHVNAWQQQSQQQDQDSQGQHPARRPSPYLFLNERYATAAAMQQVQSQSAGNFGLPKGFVDPRSDLPAQDPLVDNSFTSSSPVVALPFPVAPAPQASNVLPTRPAVPPFEENATRRPGDQVVEEQVPVPSSLPTKPASTVIVTAKPTRTQRTPIPATSSIPSKVEPSVALTQNAVPEASDPVAPLKPAWSAVSPIVAGGGPSVGTSLREIQEAEAKRSDARKAAEREKEKASRAANPVSSPADDLPKSTSWGLMQVGQRAAAPAPSTSATPTPAWSSASNVKAASSKKTMKEIQEEEEKRKKALAARDAANGLNEGAFVTAAGRKASVETAKTPDAVKGSGPWTTVGSSGKAIPSSTATTPASAIAQTRPPASGARSTATIAAGSPAAKPAILASVASKKVDDKIPPSPDFVKWVKEALRGLNGVNVDEFITMLFDFSIDPDPSTIEIISEFVYANSSTLDGRRFASEFVAKRKVDAASRVGKIPAGKPISIAEVVKTQPKPVQAEWAYKVVKKKGKRT